MGERTRLLLAISDLRGGGAEREFASLANHLSRDRFEIHAVFWRSTAVYELSDDIATHFVKKERPWHVFGAIRGFRRLIEELQPDLVFSQLHYVNMVMGTALARSSYRPKWICRLVNDPKREMSGPWAWWARRSLGRADKVLGASDGVTGAIVEHLRIDPNQAATIVNAVDVELVERRSQEPLSLDRDEGRFVVVHAGRLTRQKNQTMLLQAFSELSDPRAELWVLGEGELADELRASADSLGVADRVKWLGFQRNPYPFFRAADCFALSSDHEGLPNVLIESMICGTPAVSTRCNYGPEELIEDGKTGFLTPVGDPEAFGRALTEVASDPARAAEMGRLAQAAARRRFETSVVTAQYEALFERTVRT